MERGERLIMEQEMQRLPAEQLFQKEIDALIANETYPIPTGWRMSPRSVLTYICGGKSGDVEITPKYIGHERLVEIAISTLVTEEQIRYSWNYAMLIANGPSREAMIPSPIYRAMEQGMIARVEEISRCASEVQDALISILSEKRISVPELGVEIPARKGFSVIATANTRDKGVNDMSAALKRRFNIVVLPSPESLEAEMEIVETRIRQLAGNLDLNARLPEAEVVKKVCTIFRELRAGVTLDGKQKLKSTSGVLSTAEAISLLANSMALAGSFGDGQMTDADLAAGLQGAVVKEDSKDGKVWEEYLENIMKKRGSKWLSLYQECRELNG